jgi:hypothetical protein
MRALPLLGLLSLTGCGTAIAAATTGSASETVVTDGGLDDGGHPFGVDGSIGFDGNVPIDGGFCNGSGPLIPIPGANTECTGVIGATTFLFAVCSCQDVNVSGNLITDSLAPTDGGSPGNGGSIGTNGALDTNSQLKVNGSVWSLATGEATAVHVKETSTIFGDVHAGAVVQADPPSALTIADNLYVNGDVNGTVSCDMAYIPSGDTGTGLTASGGVMTSPVVVPAPCDCTNILDIAAIVSSFANANDDSAVGLTASSFATFPSTPVTLPCGQYYFDGVGGGAVNLTIGGRAAVFVNGDFDAETTVNLTLAPDAQLDLFISGNLHLSDATLGASDSPARVRVYVGGNAFTLDGTATIGANIYAPNANVELASDFEMAGSLFVGSLQLSGAFTIHYDESILSTAGCPPTVGSCKSCHDCAGATPACIGGSCAACVVDGDCCPPLHCSQGQCYDEIP